MCDGYYFPISHGVSRAQLTRDAAACQSSCGTDARLFYAPSNGSADDFVDLGGRSYTQIPNAFKYRKALSPACACKPAPWSEAELARHQRYAAEAARTAAPVAVTQPDPSTSQGRLAAAGKPDSRPDGKPAGKAKATAVAAGGSGTSVMVVEAPAPASAAKDASGSHAVQDAAAAKAPAQPHAAASATLSEPQHIKPPAAAGPSRIAGSSTGPSARPAPRVGAGGPAQPQVKLATKPAASAVPVYSHEQGRFVFPGDRRYQ